jgi:hypothetical protein
MPVLYFLVGTLLHLLGLHSLIVSQQPQKIAPKNREGSIYRARGQVYPAAGRMLLKSDWSDLQQVCAPQPAATLRSIPCCQVQQALRLASLKALTTLFVMPLLM